MNELDKVFIQGFSVALGCLANGFGMPNLAKMIADECNFTMKDFEEAGCEECDIGLIRKEFQ